MIRCSILIPAYNNTEKQKLTLLESINQQTVVNQIQVIIVDDGSTESLRWTEKFLQQHLQSEFQLYFFSANQGVGASRKYLFNKLNTEYFVTIDSDDALASPTIIQEYIDFLDHNLEYECVNSYIKCTAHGLSTEKIEQDANDFHGFCGRTSMIKKYGLTVLDTQYAEDGIFFQALHIYEIPKKTLNTIGYIRKEGYLTNYICWPMTDLNHLNDIYNHLRGIQLLPIYNHRQKERQFFTIMALLQDLESQLQILKQNDMGQAAAYWEIYYSFISLSLFSPDMLQKIKDHLLENQFHHLIYYIDSILLFTPKMQHPILPKSITFMQAEEYCQKWVHNFFNNFTPKKTETLPYQVIKNFPWCYKTLRW